MENFNILVVDDIALNITAVEAALDGPGINLITALSGNEALGALLDNKIDLVLLDVQMPDMDGFEVAELMRAKEATRSIPIIFITAISKEQQYVFKGYSLGAVDYLFKPVDPDVLRCKVNVFTRLHRQQTIIEEKVGELETANKELALYADARDRQLQIKDRFLSHVSHELRTPLTAIHQFVTIILDGLAGDINSEQRRYLEIVLKNAGQLKHMIGDLLDITREVSGKLTVRATRIFIEEVVAETLQTLEKISAEKLISLSAQIPSTLPAVYADAARLRQILTNLIENGIKFTGEKGEITLRAGFFAEDPAFIFLQVSDTGCGIEPEDKEAIFQRLYQSESTIENSRSGLGLGLHICKTLVERQGGRIWLTSKVGRGSSFFFTLPIYSVEGLLRPILKESRARGGDLIVITLEARVPEAIKNNENIDDILTEVFLIITRCIHPYEDEDFIMPRSQRLPYGEVFSIIASTNHKGAEAIKKRVTEKLRRAKGLQDFRLEVCATHKMLEPCSAGKDMRLEDFVKNRAAEIEKIINNEMAERRACS